MGKTGTHFPVLLCLNEGIGLEITASNCPEGVAQNPAQYTAAEGGIEGQEEEIAPLFDFTQPVDTTALNGKKRHRAASCVKSLNYQSGGQGIRTLNRFPGN